MGSRISWWSHRADFVDHSVGALACVFADCGHNNIMLVAPLRYAEKCIVNIMYIERNNLQLELIRYSIKMTLFTFTFAKKQIRPPNA